MNNDSHLLREALKALAPGSEIREGLQRIQHGHTGALIVLGYPESIEQMCSGGFELDVECTAARLRELAKMDGAVIVSSDLTRIRRANVQLVPDRSIPTTESGMRHRTAQRVARQSGVPVVSLSASMRVITLYVGTLHTTVEEPEALLARANLALATLDRYSQRLGEDLTTLTILEQRDNATLRDVAIVLQRMEMIRRIYSEINGYVEELGSEGRLLALQIDDLVRGAASERALVMRDYMRSPDRLAHAERTLAGLDGEALVNLTTVASSIGHPALESSDLDRVVTPRGYRALSMVPRLPWSIIEALTTQWSSLPQLREATREDLQSIEGVGPYRAGLIVDALERQYQAAAPDIVGW